MNERSRAAEDLRVIRSLMERATIYRAISAPTALVGGLLAVATATALCFFAHSRPVETTEHDCQLFAAVWIAVLVVVLAVNAFFVRREARRNGRPFISAGARLAIRAILPCLVIPAVATVWFFQNADPIDTKWSWSLSGSPSMDSPCSRRLSLPRALSAFSDGRFCSAACSSPFGQNRSPPLLSTLPEPRHGRDLRPLSSHLRACIWSARRPVPAPESFASE